ncbi:MAG: helix-hairpin-helix domain-containing protein, partial [Candidatus Omnitrophica bacterium]|nr:helix-hairpin-helix domain-containing protein [Candidatus Omnitrophota bacterium]
MVGLTRQERIVVLFLMAMALVGIGASGLFKISPGFKELNLTLQRKININNATADELISLPGIGPKSAARIIEYRQSQREFRELADLKKIKGICNRTL